MTNQDVVTSIVHQIIYQGRILKQANKHDKGKDYEDFRVSQVAQESLIKVQRRLNKQE